MLDAFLFACEKKLNKYILMKQNVKQIKYMMNKVTTRKV